MSDRNLKMPEAGKTVVAAWVAIASVGTFRLLLLLLHFVESELDPSWHFIREYEIGKYGWVMQLAFLALALGNAGLFVAIRYCMTGLLGRIGSFLFLVGTFGTVHGGICITDPINTAPEAVTMSGKAQRVTALRIRVAADPAELQKLSFRTFQFLMSATSISCVSRLLHGTGSRAGESVQAVPNTSSIA